MNRTAMKSLAGIACSIALATTFAGCGSDDSDKSSNGNDAASTLTSEEFLTQADAICKAQESAETAAISAAVEAAEAGDEAASQEAIASVVEIIRGEADAISELKAPDEIKEEVAALVTSLNAGLDTIAEQGFDAPDALSDASKKAKDLGLTECGN